MFIVHVLSQAAADVVGVLLEERRLGPAYLRTCDKRMFRFMY